MIVVYEGAGTGDPTREGIQAFLTWAGLPWRGVGPSDLTAESLADVDAVYWPGGWAWPYVRDVPPEGKQAVRDVVARGGAYVGVCAGAYHAADLIRWQGRFTEYDLDLFRGVAEGPIDAIEPWKGWRLTDLELHDHPINDGEAEHHAIYWGGPAFRLHPAQEAEVLASYAATGDPAAITFAYGRGQVLLMGCHLELGWDAGAQRWDLAGGHGAQWGWLERAVRWTIAQGAGRR